MMPNFRRNGGGPPPLIEETSSQENTFREKELSFYALSDMESIDDIVRSQRVRSPSEFSILRIMHCGALTSMKGIAHFTSLRELNLSSNSLMSMTPLFESKASLQIEILNLSCNKLTQVFSLATMGQTLRKLILSHNRIVTIQALGTNLGYTPALEHLDLNDNFIGDLE